MCGPGGIGRMSREASLRNDTGTYILKNEQGWPDKRKKKKRRQEVTLQKKETIRVSRHGKVRNPSVFIKLQAIQYGWAVK